MIVAAPSDCWPTFTQKAMVRVSVAHVRGAELQAPSWPWVSSAPKTRGAKRSEPPPTAAIWWLTDPAGPKLAAGPAWAEPSLSKV